MLVLVEAWQLQCCGKAFAAGDVVGWTLSSDVDRQWLSLVVGDARAEQVERREDHHVDLPPDAPLTRARVERIRAASARYARSVTEPRTLEPIPGGGRVVDVPHADGYEPEGDGLRFVGYLVDVVVLDPGDGPTGR